MHMDPALPRLVAALWIVVLLALAGRRVGQPMPVVYIAAGVLLGPAGLALVTDTGGMSRLGELGIVLLLFLLGTEIKLDSLLGSWKVPVVGLFVQVAASLACAAAVGAALEWPAGRIVLIGFAISLSSTAVVLRLLETTGLKDQPIGRDVLSILLAQDLALAPMLVVLGILGGGHVSLQGVSLQLVGAVVLLGTVIWVARQGTVHLPFARHLSSDGELQVFVALLMALTMALFSAVTGLSAAFGAFVAGVVIGATEEERWVHHSLHPLRVVLVAAFLLSVGMLLELGFIVDNLGAVGGLAVAALVTNTVINTALLKIVGRTWGEALLGGALLSQIGEFSFVLASIGIAGGLLSAYGSDLLLSVIACTLLLSALWISAVRAVLRGRGLEAAPQE